VLCDFGTAKVNNPEIAKKIPKKAFKNPDPKSYSSIPESLLHEEGERVFSFVGTEDYVAPEILLD
jgi:serine/threonine protein kinase